MKLRPTDSLNTHGPLGAFGGLSRMIVLPKREIQTLFLLPPLVNLLKICRGQVLVVGEFQNVLVGNTSGGKNNVHVRVLHAASRRGFISHDRGEKTKVLTAHTGNFLMPASWNISLYIRLCDSNSNPIQVDLGFRQLTGIVCF